MSASARWRRVWSRSAIAWQFRSGIALDTVRSALLAPNNSRSSSFGHGGEDDYAFPEEESVRIQTALARGLCNVAVHRRRNTQAKARKSVRPCVSPYAARLTDSTSKCRSAAVAMLARL